MSKKIFILVLLVISSLSVIFISREAGSNKQANLIIRCRGGICDQIIMFVAGQKYKDLGFNVKYDISEYPYYERGDHIRSFQLDKAFPCFNKLFKPSKDEINLCKSNIIEAFSDDYTYKDTEYRATYITHNALYTRWWDLFKKDALEQNLNEIFKFDKSTLDENNISILNEIKEEAYPVCVHVRRGDTTFKQGFQVLQEPKYFCEGCEEILKKQPEAKFYFFSEDPEWCKEELLPLLPQKTKSKIMSCNGEDEVYKDLYLMSNCSAVIRSGGSMGEIAYKMIKSPQKLLVAFPENYRLPGMRHYVKPDIIIQ